MSKRLVSCCALVTLCLVTAGVVSLLPVRADDGDPPGCEGLTAYMKELRAVTVAVFLDFTEGRVLWTPQLNDMEEEGLLLAAQEWERKASAEALQRIADYHQGYGDGLEQITPPDWLREWHAMRLIEADLALDYVTEGMAIGPVAAAHKYIDRFDALNAAVQARVVASCPTFLQLLHDNDLYGDSVDYERLTPTVVP